MTNWRGKDILEKFFKQEPSFSVSLVEDNKLFLQSLKSTLAQSFGGDISIKAFSDSNSLIKSLKEPPNVLVMDYHLDSNSSIDGIELVKYVRLHSPSTQIIVLTGEENVEKALECYNEGVANFIKKDFDAIKKVVKELIYKKDLSSV